MPGEEQAERIWLTRTLLESYLDYLPGQLRASLQTTSGVTAGKDVPCQICQGKGKVLYRQRLRLCPVCGGDGWRRRQTGEEAYDRYTQEPVSDTQEITTPRVYTLSELDSQLARIERLLREREGVVDDFAWVKKKRSMRASGDYEQLEWQLLWLRSRHPLHFRHLWNGMVLGWQIPNQDSIRLIDEAVALLEPRLPTPIRVPPWYMPDPYARKRALHQGKTPAHKKARGERNMEIRRRYLEGESTTKLAIAFLLTRRQVQNIVAGVRRALSDAS